MSYDDWKCTPPDDSGFELPEEGEDEPEYTCDCGAPLDPSLPVSMCRGCWDSCEPSPEDDEMLAEALRIERATFAELCAASDREDEIIRAAGGDPDHECPAATCPVCNAA